MTRAAFLFLFLSMTLFGQMLQPVFKGNAALGERELFDSLGLRLPYAFEFWKKRPRVQADTSELLCSLLERRYRAKGYYHVRVGSQVRGDTLEFRIDEGEPVIVKSVATESMLDLSALMVLKPGERFDADRFAQGKSAVRAEYAEAGYCNAKHRSKAYVDVETNEAYLLFEVDPGSRCYFGQVSVEPSETIDADIIASLLEFQEGDLYTPEKIRRSYNALYAQEGVAAAMIDVRERNASMVKVHVGVSEPLKPIRLKTGVGASSDEGLQLLAALKHRNLFGNLKTAEIEARYSQVSQSLTGTLNVPLLSANRFGAEAGYKEERFDGYRERALYQTLFLRQRDDRHALRESVRFERLDTYDSSDGTLFPAQSYFITSPQLEYTYDSRDRLLDPSGGFYVSPQISGAYRGVLSETTYLKGVLSAAKLWSVDSAVLGMRIRLGHVRSFDGELPSSYRFYAGGMNSNRAYGYRQLGPKNGDGDAVGFDTLAEATLEYRRRLSPEFKAVLFSDVTRIADAYLPMPRSRFVALGVGLRYVTPVGPLAIDAGVDVDDPEQYAFHFHIGELF